MKKIIKKYHILIPIIFLNIISLCYLYKTTYFKKQCLWFSLGLILIFICQKINIKNILKKINIFYFLSLMLLLTVLLFGREINGSKAWLHFFNISLQPSEIAKLVLIIYLPYLILKNKNFLFLFLVVLIPSILTFLEPDTGAIIIYFLIFLSALKYKKINKNYLALISFIALSIITSHIYLYINHKNILINIYGPKLFYRFDRLISFKNQDNIQNIYSQIAIGSHNLVYIPENHNDFILASIISKYPLYITILVYLSYIYILSYFIIKITKEKNISNIYNYIVLNMLLFQIFYNILMNLSLVPIIGLPLPFLSYGGSNIITLYIIIGLSLNLFNRNMVLDKDDKDNKELD